RRGSPAGLGGASDAGLPGRQWADRPRRGWCDHPLLGTREAFVVPGRVRLGGRLHLQRRADQPRAGPQHARRQHVVPDRRASPDRWFPRRYRPDWDRTTRLRGNRGVHTHGAPVPGRPDPVRTDRTGASPCTRRTGHMALPPTPVLGRRALQGAGGHVYRTLVRTGGRAGIRDAYAPKSDRPRLGGIRPRHAGRPALPGGRRDGRVYRDHYGVHRGPAGFARNGGWSGASAERSSGRHWRGKVMTRRTAYRRPSRRTLLVAAIVTAVGAPALASAGALAASSGSSAAPAAPCVGQALPTLGGPYGDAIAAATNGDIAGIASTSSGASQAVLWHAGKVQQIRTGLADSVPAGINAHGDVVGNAPNGENTVGWAWSGNRTVRLRGTGELAALPAAISNGGVIAGALETTEGTPSEGDGKPGTSENEQAAVWRSSTGAPQILAPLPGDQGAHA